jgi:hypothetical protein
MSRWYRSNRFDPRALPLADRHYNRRKVGSPQFVPPGRCVVLLNLEADALWVSSWPYAQYVRHAWPGAWVNSLFRREAGELSSEAIRAAVAATRFVFGDPPPLGMVTFINPRFVPGYFRRTPDGTVLEWGYSYRKAGFVDAEPRWTKGGLAALQLWPAAMPDAVSPVEELDLFDCCAGSTGTQEASG